MQNPYVRWLFILIVLLVPIGWLAWPTNTNLIIPLPGDAGPFTRDISIRQGLDLQGGLQVLLEADLPADQAIDASAMETVRTIIESRVNSLGVSEPVVQVAGDRRIVVELPGISDTEQALALLRQTALLEFVDTGNLSLPEGSVVQTDHATSGSTTPAVTATATTAEGGTATSAPAETQTGSETPAATEGATAAATTSETPTGTGTAGATTTAEPTEAPTGPVYHTVLTGDALESATVQQSEAGQRYIAFKLTSEAAPIFAEYTTSHVQQFLTIVLDKRVLSSPRINSPITGGEGIIEGQFTIEEANNLVIALRYGSLPVPLKLAESRVIGPTLGQDSLNKSLVAGAIGLGAVMIFMLLYYRLPGVIANLSLIVYALLALAVFKFIPVTLTLAGVAGFMLSTGSALDANILIFERLKEELRDGKKLGVALDLAWRRAWSSIRDSNIATIIICLILLWFASSFGATIVRGFAVTLLIGVAISLFTALVVTRVLLNSVLSAAKITNYSRWFGI